jgi:NADH:ubiquinone oxidoreductase subunit 6 (subunit J)
VIAGSRTGLMMRLPVVLNLLIVVLIGAVGVYAFFESWNISPGFFQVLGADAYPRIVAAILVVLCAAYLVNVIVGVRTAPEQAPAEQTEENADATEAPILQDVAKSGISMLFMWVLFIGYIILMPILGYFQATFVFLLFSIFSLSYRYYGINYMGYAVLFAAVIVAVLWIVMIYLLGVYLPPGTIWR